MSKNKHLSVVGMVKRNIRVFLKDKAAVFFSLLAPLILLLLFVLFLGDVQKEVFLQFVGEGSEKAVNQFVNNWLIASVLGVSSITVALSSFTTMIDDRQNDIVNDFIASPLSKSAVTVSYIISSVITTFVINFVVLLISFVFLGATGSMFLSFVGVLELIGALLLSAISAVTLMFLIVRFFKTQGALNAFVGVMSAFAGFIIGAYMPISNFPKAIQTFTVFVPGTHACGIFKNILLAGPLEEFAKFLPQEAVADIAKSFDLSFNFFNTTVEKPAMYIVLASSIVLFAVVNILVSVFSKGKKNGVNKTPKQTEQKVD